MRFFLLKCMFIVGIISVIIGVIVFVDVFNVFHYNDIRFTDAEPNKNYVKTKYVIKNPDKFNAFIFGSSRVGNIPSVGLPRYNHSNEKLSWYNMTYSMGVPAEHLETIKTFIKNNVKIKYIVIGVDNISASTNPNIHKNELLRKPYQLMEIDPVNFYWSYIWNMADIDSIKHILPQVLRNYINKDIKAKNLFYKFGVSPGNEDMNIPNKVDEKKFELNPVSPYTYKNVMSDLKEIVEICRDKGIELIIFTSPIYERGYLTSVKHGQYLLFLRDLAQIYPYYNFSGLNRFTKDKRYYFDWSHYRPYVGREIEKSIWGLDHQSDEKIEKLEYSKNTGFGMKVDHNNIDILITLLQNQL